MHGAAAIWHVQARPAASIDLRDASIESSQGIQATMQPSIHAPTTHRHTPLLAPHRVLASPPLSSSLHPHILAISTRTASAAGGLAQAAATAAAAAACVPPTPLSSMAPRLAVSLALTPLSADSAAGLPRTHASAPERPAEAAAQVPNVDVECAWPEGSGAGAAAWLGYQPVPQGSSDSSHAAAGVVLLALDSPEHLARCACLLASRSLP